MRAVLLVLAACGSGSANVDATVAPAASTIVPTGASVAVAAAGDFTYTFDAERVAVMRGTNVVARAAAPAQAKWTGAAALRAPDGDRWVVGIANGVAWRVTSSGELEPAAPRLAVTGARALSIAALDDSWVIGLSGGFAYSRDGLHVQRFRGADANAVALASNRIAIATRDGVEVYDLGANDVVTFRTRADRIAFLDARAAKPLLVVQHGGTVYIERDETLQRVRAPSRLREIAVSDRRIWMLADNALFSFDGGALARATVDAASSRIHAAPGGDVWIAQRERARRVTLDTKAADAWKQIAPVFERGCAECHRPGGEGGLDLSSATSWIDHRTALRDVLTSREMPPKDHPLSEADRAVLLDWLAR